MRAVSPAGITRRTIAVTALAPAAMAMQAQPPAAGDELSAARQQTQRTIETLRKFKIPMATEPSFVFHP